MHLLGPCDFDSSLIFCRVLAIQSSRVPFVYQMAKTPVSLFGTNQCFAKNENNWLQAMKSTDFLNTSALRSLRMASIGNAKTKNKKVVIFLAYKTKIINYKSSSSTIFSKHWLPHVTLEALLKNHNHNHVRRKGKKRIKH